MTNINVPALLQEISSLIEWDFKEQSKFLQLVNITPKKEWIREHPMAKNVKYIPIGIIETMMQRIFGQVKIEIKDFKQIANSVCVSVRVHYLNPVTNEWEYQDWLGASPIQIKKDSNSAVDFAMMQTNAIQLALPSAESYAIKDACEHIGALFGRDLNRKEFMEYSEIYPDEKLPTIKRSEYKRLISEANEAGVWEASEIVEHAKKHYHLFENQEREIKEFVEEPMLGIHKHSA